LGLPRALAVAGQAARSRLPGAVKRELLMDFDRVLGLDVVAARTPSAPAIPADVEALARQRDELRRRKAYPEADSIRERIRAIGSSAEIIVVDNGLEEGCSAQLDTLAVNDERIRLFHGDHFLGAAAGLNIVLKQARGRHIVTLDTSVEVKGDIFTPLRNFLADPRVGIVGRWGVTSEDLRSFEEAEASGDVDAVEGYLMAFRRELVNEIGLLDEKYRFYRHLDLDYSLAARTAGYRLII